MERGSEGGEREVDQENLFLISARGKGRERREGATEGGEKGEGGQERGRVTRG